MISSILGLSLLATLALSAPLTEDSVVTADTQANNSSFTCYGRSIGYYGDVEQACRVYHFCLLGDYNGDIVYQRISYLCLNETVFDQQALDCVESDKISSPCKESANFYDVSNDILRQAIVGTQKDQKSINETALASTPADAPSASTPGSSTGPAPATTPAAPTTLAPAPETTPTAATTPAPAQS